MDSNIFLIFIGAMAAIVLFIAIRNSSKRKDSSTVSAEPAMESPREAAPTVAPSDGIDARTLAIITAAAHAVAGRPVQVRRVTFLNKNTISAWAEMGRITIQSSHNVRKSL